MTTPSIHALLFLEELSRPSLLPLFSWYLFAPSFSGSSSQSSQRPPELVDVDELIARIQEHVINNRIRVSEHFQDFDPLRSGSISAARFRQVLVSLEPRFSVLDFVLQLLISSKAARQNLKQKAGFEARYVLAPTIRLT